MYLTREEEKIYDGEQGWARQISMRILVKLGDLFGATRLIPVSSAHLSGVSYKTLGDAPIEFLEALAESGAKASVASTVNPSSFDNKRISDMAISPTILERQFRIIELYERMGADSVLTCTPYYIAKPKRGAHLAWAESSAVVYANSLLGAWTNREGGPSALAAALIGKTPDYGMHKPENRQPNVLVKVEARLANEAEYGALGAYLGQVIGGKIPLLEGLSGYDETDLKQMGAAMASTGRVSIFHQRGSCQRQPEKLEILSVDDAALKETVEGLSTTQEEPDLVFIGCPHCSFNEVKQVAEMIRGKKIREDVRFWVCTSRCVREKAKDYVETIEAAGGRAVSDTCVVVSWIKEIGVETLMTNSAKTAYYAPTMNGVKVRFAPLAQCIRTASKP